VQIDVTGPNMIRIAAGMGKPTRNELLAEYYLRAAGVAAAVWIDATGHVGAQDVASIENEPDRIVYCCERGHHFVLAYRLYEWKKAVEADQAAIAAKLEEIAELGGVGLTPHQTAVDRALEAVTAVNDTIDKMGSTGELKSFNRAFKDARKAEKAPRRPLMWKQPVPDIARRRSEPDAAWLTPDGLVNLLLVANRKRAGRFSDHEYRVAHFYARATVLRLHLFPKSDAPKFKLGEFLLNFPVKTILVAFACALSAAGKHPQSIPPATDQEHLAAPHCYKL
jgi:hypothetical protein